MKPTVHKYKVGDKVLLHGKEVTIERTGVNINKLPIYKIGGVWRFEHELEDWYPPCPV
jgi:hypothetical protein